MPHSNELDDLRALVMTLTSRVDALQSELEDQQGHGAAASSEVEVEVESAVTRRNWMKAAAAAAVGGTAVALSGSDRVAARDTDSIKIGQTNNVGLSRTVAHHEGAGGPDISFLFKTDIDDGSAGANADFPAALAGWSDSRLRPHGIHGLAAHTNASGVGVIGESKGPAGKGVRGIARSNGGIGVDGEGRHRGVRGMATHDGGIGVEGEGGRLGVSGIGDHTGVFADGGEYGVHGRGTKGSFLLEPMGFAPPTLWPLVARAGALYGQMSDLTVSDEELMSVWCSVSDDGQWRQLAGPDTAGSLHPVEPTRVYDSRLPAPTPGKLSSGANRPFSVASGRDPVSGAVSELDFVPAGAQAVAYNLTITETEGSGFLAITPGTSTSSTASSINWSASGLILANAGIVRVDSERSLRAFCGGGGRTHFLIDITGYYL